MNLSTYQNLIETIGLSNLDEANKETYNIVKEGSANFSDPSLWNEMLSDADIKEAYDLHVKALQQLAREEPKAEMQVSKKKETKSKVRKQPKVERVKADAKAKKKTRTKKTKSVKKSSKKTKAKKTITAKKKQEVKYPVTVKRLSKELQLIKRMASWDGKRKSINALMSLNRELEKVLKSKPDRKPVLSDIHRRIKGALLKAENAGVKELDITLDAAFKSRLIEIANHPRPKMKVEYLAGVDTGKK